MSATPRTMADALAALGVSPGRVLMDPPPGTATEADLIAWNERPDRVVRCELVDGMLVLKDLIPPETDAGQRLAAVLNAFLEREPVGVVAGAGAFAWFAADRLSLPDVSVVVFGRRPDPARVVPNVVVEVLCGWNTRRDVDRKLGEYFAAGVELVWQIDPDTRSAAAYTSPTAVTAVPPGGALDGGTVLPGLVIPLAGLFAGFEPPAAA